MDGAGNPPDDTGPDWDQLRYTVLRRRTQRLIGMASSADEDTELRFSIALQPAPGSDITVTVDDRCELADIHDLCHRVASACLDDDDHVTFTRTPNDDTVR